MEKLSENNELRQLANLDLLARQVVEGFITGLHQSPFHGFSVEFAEHRLYNSGESVKNIDWKLFAKTDKLFVKQFEEETNLRCYLLLDTSSSMNYPETGINKLQFSIYAIASLMYLFKKQRDAFGLCLFADEVEWLSAVRSTSTHLFYLFAQLEKAYQQPKKNAHTHLSNVIHRIAQEAHQRSLIIIFSDMLENSAQPDHANALFAALQHLKYNKHEVLIFNVNDRLHEQEFSFDNRPHRFVDAETGEQVNIHPHQMRDIYKTAYQEYRHQLQLKCAQFGVDWVDADIQQGYYNLLKEYLIKRNKMV
ncbi:DUF58 domain-containing protein [Mucilaginibacter koreensis]